MLPDEFVLSQQGNHRILLRYDEDAHDVTIHNQEWCAAHCDWEDAEGRYVTLSRGMMDKLQRIKLPFPKRKPRRR